MNIKQMLLRWITKFFPSKQMVESTDNANKDSITCVNCKRINKLTNGMCDLCLEASSANELEHIKVSKTPIIKITDADREWARNVMKNIPSVVIKQGFPLNAYQKKEKKYD